MFLRAAGRGFRRIAFAAAVLVAAGAVGALAPPPTVAQASYSYDKALDATDTDSLR
jgi:hypothetical protein